MTDSLVDDTLGLVLAGGDSSRFGSDKALFPVGGIPMARLVYRALTAVIRDVRVGLSRPGQRNPVGEAAAVYDDPPGQGPLGSLRAGLLAAGDRWLLAAACDMPGLSSESVERLLSGRTGSVDVVVGMDSDGRRHPLAAAWHPRVLPLVESFLAGDRRSVTALLDSARSVDVPLSHDELRNVNRPGDTRFPPTL